MKNERKLKKLTSENEDFVFDGDLFIDGNVSLTNCNLIVSGSVNVCGKINVLNGDIVCQTLECHDISIKNGDIRVNALSAHGNIKSTGNVEVSKDVYVLNVKALNYLVSGNNDSCEINADHDVYILGNNNSCTIKAREVFVSGDCDLNDYPIVAKHFECSKELYGCSRMSIGN